MYGRPDKAIVRLNQARVLWPDSAATYRWLAEAYEAAGQPSSAIANYCLLFYGWPGRKSLIDIRILKPGETPSDKPGDYNQANPEITDPTLLMQFSLLLQQTGQENEAWAIYERGMEALSNKVGNKREPLPPLSSDELTSPEALEAATRTALAIAQSTYLDRKGAQENLKRALELQPDSSVASYYQTKLLK
jgi:tetratricopeptide (TPR) repeat protein